MKTYHSQEIKNIALLGSKGVGKTTLAEAMLYECGIIKRRGSVKNQNTVLDYFPVEREYEYSVFSTVFYAEYLGKKLNVMDCPGSDDFVGGAVTGLAVMDTALMMVDAHYGVEVATRNLFNQSKKSNKPVMFVINQLDVEHADYDQVLEQLKSNFGSHVVVIQYPLSCGPSFNAVIDVLKMKMYQWGPQGGEPQILDIPAEELEKAEVLHQALVEAAAENDDELMEKFFEQGTLCEQEMRDGIHQGLLKRNIHPVFCVDAERDMGVRRLMEFVGNVAPSVSEVEPVMTKQEELVSPDESGPTSLYFFKTTVEPHIGEISYFKVMSGTLKEGADLYDVTRGGNKERLSQLYCVCGSLRVKVSELKAGDIGVAVKLKDVRTGSTLNDKGCDYEYDIIKYPAAKYSRAVRAVTESESEKLNEILLRIHEEDPTLMIVQSKELRQTLVYGQGEFHLRTLKWRVEHNDKVMMEYLEPRIPYRETITKAARADFRHKKQSGGAGQFGEVHMIVEPFYDGMPMPSIYKFNGQEYRLNVRDTQVITLDWGGRLVFVNCIVGGTIDNRFMPAILKGLMDRMEQGPLTGSYARDVRVCVYDGKMHPVDSNEISFRLAGRHAFSEAFKMANPKILEPVYDVDIWVPADRMGDVMSDLQTRRALIMGMNSENGFEKLQAKVPLKEMSNYSTALSSLTGGRASFSMSFADYELVPGDVQEKLLREYEKSEVCE